MNDFESSVTSSPLFPDYLEFQKKRLLLQPLEETPCKTVMAFSPHWDSWYFFLRLVPCTKKFLYKILCVLFYSSHQHREFITQIFSYSILILDSSIHIWVISQTSKVISHNFFSVMTNILDIAFIRLSNCFQYFHICYLY